MSNQYGPKIVTNGLALCLDAGNIKSYPGSGTSWTDLSGNGNTGTLLNGVGYNSGNGGSLVFDGSNDYVVCNPSGLNILNISVGAWVKFTNMTIDISVFMSRYIPGANGWFIYYYKPTNQFSVDGRENSSAYYSLRTTKTYEKTNWNYVVWTKSASIWSLYVNGVFDASNTFGNGISPFVETNLSIGAYVQFNENYYPNCNLSTTHIYNRTLSAAEILQKYNALKGRFNL